MIDNNTNNNKCQLLSIINYYQRVADELNNNNNYNNYNNNNK